MTTADPDDLRLFQHRFVPGSPGASLSLLLLHGTGGNEDDLLPLGPMLATGAPLLSPRGQVLENGMPRFFRRFAEGVLDVEDLKARAAQLGRFIRAAREQYGVAGLRLLAVGFSNGANIAAGLLLTDPAALDGAVLFRAMPPFTPAAPLDLHGKRVFVGAGRTDPLVRPAQSERLAAMLRGAGADVTLHWEDAGHELTRGDIDAAHAWVAASPAKVGGGS